MKKFLATVCILISSILCVNLCACDFFSVPAGLPELKPTLTKYEDALKWNFAVDYTEIDGGSVVFEDYYEYLGYNILNKYTEDGVTYSDYLSYDKSTDTYYFYSDNGDGTYGKYAEGTAEYEQAFAYLYLINLTELGNFNFTSKGSYYTAVNPIKAGNAVLGKYEDSYWTELNIYVENGLIVKVAGILDDGYTMQFAFSKQGEVSFTIPKVTDDDPDNPNPTPTPTPTPTPNPPTPTNTMEKQTYNPDAFDHDNIQDKMLEVDSAIGLPSKGNISALVIPVQFRGDTITQKQLTNLNTAFNGTSAETGWESVKTYYQKASYGKLNLSFDIQPVYQANNTSSYYERYSKKYTQNGQTYTKTGEEVILEEALAYYESRLDLTKYDTNGDGCIDAVYLIYSAPVDYDKGDFYWAYVTWYFGSTQYDGRDAYFYLFAGFDFMDEDLDLMPGMKINAATYIHETGHLLGLDDYYDYDQNQGSNEGLGGADMMDYTVGDQNVYSKMMLGWLEPTIVNSTQTVTIQSSQASASAILIPLNFDNSYFCEYLLIDLYSAEGLNKLHSSMKDSVLYDGASFGVRIYHVTSWINNPYGSEFGSFTDNDNSISDVALIKLVEADGERKFAGSGGYASLSDLWQTGGKLSNAFPAYTRNDGKKVNFDISIDSVSSSSASITITFE